ncbi:MAG TPA: dTMP kinase [candidate division WOR-3 bacterium]|uniref:Thymidylate kinase n=1 Tax=candidate division WOR-3 bacterium TaxID=2052148 RepID=A0A7V0T5F7_UNCW3|nr:dTMP kinase [candidate division WOR-3 bacterium]
MLTFEGVEGSGKSTQVERLAVHLRGLGLSVLVSREPGGTDIGERIRAVLLDPDAAAMDGRTELFLYLASRNQHVREKLMPALRAGTVIILDRFSESSLAYQGGGRELGERVVSRLNKLATAGLRPDLTILVDLPVEVGRRRKEGSRLDRLERERVEFHQRVRDSYIRLARRAPKRIRIVDGTRPAEESQVEVRRLATEVLKRKGLI